MGRPDATILKTPTKYTPSKINSVFITRHDFTSHLIASLYHAHIRQCNSGVRDSENTDWLVYEQMPTGPLWDL